MNKGDILFACVASPSPVVLAAAAAASQVSDKKVVVVGAGPVGKMFG